MAFIGGQATTMAGFPPLSDITATVDIGGSGRGIKPIATPRATTKAALVTANVRQNARLSHQPARRSARRTRRFIARHTLSGGAISFPACASGVNRASHSATTRLKPGS